MAITSADDNLETADNQLSFLQGRFEARFGEWNGARAAARDARSCGFRVDVHQQSADSWLIVGRRRQAFPADEQSRYASRLKAIATVYGGVFSRFIEEPGTAAVQQD